MIIVIINTFRKFLPVDVQAIDDRCGKSFNGKINALQGLLHDRGKPKKER